MNVYQLKIGLIGAKPPIWREIKVNNNITFGTLHEIIQEVMGWENSHLHEFTDRQKDISIRRVDGMFGVEDANISNEDKVKIKYILKRKGSRIKYIYDFGDSWEHEIKVTAVFKDKKLDYPICLKGKRACPPEDCGGVWGYANLLETIKDPKHPEHEDMIEWIGEDFDPEKFDLEKLNEILKRY